MKYQIARFERAGETWRFHREDYNIVQFDALDAAEAQAAKLADGLGQNTEVLVITVHCGYKTDREYRLVDIVEQKRTKRFELP